MFIAALAMAAASPVFAQTEQKADTTETVEYSTDKYKVETNSFWSNWFISAGAGAQFYVGEWDSKLSFGKRLSPSVDVNIGKWFTPGIGVRFGYNGVSAKGATPKVGLSTGEEIGGANSGVYKSKFHYYSFRGDAMFNLSNILCGYNEKRLYSFIPYAGFGVMKATTGSKQTEFAGHLGLLNTFRLCPALDLNLDLRGTLVEDDFDGETGGCRGEGMFSATIGLTYKFKKRGWDRAKTVVRTVYNNDELDAMRAKMNKMGEENARLQNALDEANRKAAQQAENKQKATTNVVIFEIGKSTLSTEARVSLGMLAEGIKAGDPNAVYTITGYADAGTGSKKRNEQLSKERAEAVYNCLVEEFDVNKSQLRTDYKGGVDNMFYDDPRLTRAVITKSK